MEPFGIVMTIINTLAVVAIPIVSVIIITDIIKGKI